GAVVHDLGDGMYLTDRIDVAAFYARRRAASPADERVYEAFPSNVKSGTGQGPIRILDLTTHAGWEKHIKFKIPPQSASGQWETVEDRIKRFPEQYGKTFQEFVNNPSNKINLDAYDAVIGYEYINGGKQMSILYKKDAKSGALGPSSVQGEIRKNFVL